MAAQNPTLSSIEVDDFVATSTTTSEADMRKALTAPASEKTEGTETEGETKPEPDGEAKPKEEPKPAPGEKKAEEKPPAKPDPKTPEGRKSQLQAEINALTREMHRHRADVEKTRAERAAEERQLTDLRAQLADLQAKLDKAQGGKADEGKAEPEKGKAARVEEPKEEDFDDFRDWVKAHGAWTREQARLDAEEAVAASRQKDTETEREKAEREQKARFAADRKQLADQHASRVTAYEAEHPEFAKLMDEAGALPTNDWMDEHILHSEKGPALMQYLAENPEECERISKLALGPTLVALGRIEARLEQTSETAKSGSAPERQATTKARPPVNPVGGTTAVDADAGDDDLATMDFGPEYVRRMNARERERNRARRL